LWANSDFTSEGRQKKQQSGKRWSLHNLIDWRVGSGLEPQTHGSSSSAYRKKPLGIVRGGGERSIMNGESNIGAGEIRRSLAHRRKRVESEDHRHPTEVPQQNKGENTWAPRNKKGQKTGGGKKGMGQLKT